MTESEFLKMAAEFDCNEEFHNYVVQCARDRGCSCYSVLEHKTTYDYYQSIIEGGINFHER